MTDKELLLKDLCARLNCGVEVYAQYEPTGEWYNGRLVGIDLEDEPCFTVQFYKPVPYTIYCNKKEIKPYLRPMSSMTEEECLALSRLRPSVSDAWKYIKTPVPLGIANLAQFDFFYSRHLDWRGLIPKGLALEAPEGMYK